MKPQTSAGGSTDISDIFKEFQERTENSIESLETQITDINTLQKKTESDLRALILEKEAGLQKQIDEMKAASEKITEEVKTMAFDVEDIKAVQDGSIPKDGQASVSPRGSVSGARKSIQQEALQAL